jgi:hypothetical protein
MEHSLHPFTADDGNGGRELEGGSIGSVLERKRCMLIPKLSVLKLTDDSKPVVLGNDRNFLT